MTPLNLLLGRRPLGQRPPHAIVFEPGTSVGLHTIVRKTGTWSGAGQWVLRCPSGHEFTRTASDIRRSVAKLRGPIRCRECGR